MGNATTGAGPRQSVARAILFDLDGTLVETGRSVEDVWSEFAGRHGLELRAVLTRAHGGRTVDVVASLVPELDPEREADRLESAMLAGATATPLVEPCRLFRALPDSRRAIVTSARPKTARARLRALGLPEPRVLVTAEDAGVGKPDPAPYLVAAERLGVAPGECLVLEDAPLGVAAGIGAGMEVIALTTTHEAAVLLAAGAGAALSPAAAAGEAALRAGVRIPPQPGLTPSAEVR